MKDDIITNRDLNELNINEQRSTGRPDLKCDRGAVIRQQRPVYSFPVTAVNDSVRTR